MFYIFPEISVRHEYDHDQFTKTATNSVYVSDYEVWVYFISHAFCSWVTLKMVLCHTLMKLEFWSAI